jgi:threonine/homoserine/homoserine lactone efflux protein
VSLSVILAFAVLCLLLALAPGPDTFLVLHHSLRGTGAGMAAAVGSALGSLLWAAAVAAGLATLLERSAGAYRVVKIVGGLYLLYLGVRALLRRHATAAATEAAAPAGASWSALRAGLLSCALNPKVGLFFLAVVPQFLPAGRASFAATMVLGLIDATVALAYFGVLVLASGRALNRLRRPAVTRVLDRAGGGVLAAFGVGTLATAK